MTHLDDLMELADAALGDLVEESRIEAGAVIIQIPAEHIHEALTVVRDDADLRLDVLSHMTAVDLEPREPRFSVVYELYSTHHKHRLRVKCSLAETGSEDQLPRIETVSDVYLTANWHERECYDLMGIQFDGHPDMRRILLPDRWDGHPLRKEHPYDGKRDWRLGCTVVDSAMADENLGLRGPG